MRNTNGNKNSLEQLSREYYGRTQSERILDRQIFHRDNVLYDQFIRKNKQIAQLEKEIYGANQKKIKTNDQESKEICPKEALNSVLKFINDEQKSFKVFSKIQILFKNFIQCFHPEDILQTLFLMSQCKVKFKREQINSIALDIYEYIEETEVFEDQLKFIFDILGIELKIHSYLYTDDSFVFNGLLSKLGVRLQNLSNIFDKKDDGFDYKGFLKVNAETSVERYKQRIQKQNKTVDEQVMSIKDKLQKQQQQRQNLTQVDQKQQSAAFTKIADYEFEFNDQMKEILSNFQFRFDLQLQYLLECTEDLVQFHKRQWSKASVSQFIYNLFHDYKHIFKIEQQIKIDDLVGQMQNQQAAHQIQEKKADVVNAQTMKDYLKPTHDIIDSRTISIVTDNTSVWTSKQCGL